MAAVTICSDFGAQKIKYVTGCSPPGPLSMGFPRQEYWSGLPFSSPGDLPNPGIEPLSPVLAGRFLTAEPYTGLGQGLILGLVSLVKGTLKTDEHPGRGLVMLAGSFVATSQGMPRIAGSPQRLGKGLTIVSPCEPPGSPVPGIHQARILEGVAISFNAGK